MYDNLSIYCTNTQEYVKVSGGESLKEVYDRLKDKIEIEPICARVNNKTEGLGYPVFSPKQVEYLDVTSQSGRRVYVRSLCMILFKAVVDIMPGTRLRVEHSISNGYYALLLRDNVIYTPSDEEIKALKTKMREIVNADIPFMRHEKLTTDVIELFRSMGLQDKVNLLSTSTELYTVYYTLDNIADSYYGCLAPSSKSISVFDLVNFKKGLLLLGPCKNNPKVPEKAIRQEKMYKAFTEHLEFNHVIGINDVGELNTKGIRDNGDASLIDVAEALHNKCFSKIAEDIAQRFHKGGARIVLIAGPSSSGKTTSCKRLAVHLMTNFIVPKMISLDDYFVNRVDTPKDETGEYDYESLYALDLAKFNSDLNDLIAGKEIELPYYNFEKGEREYRGNKIKLEHNNILIIEGIHGLNPELTAQIPEEQKYRVYVSALTTLNIDDHNWVPTSDNRLLRRIVRDHKYRGMSAQDTIARWQSVRKGEEKWIFPYQENANATFNSSLIFELAVMKEYAEPLLRGVPHNVPEYAEAWRLRSLLGYFTPLSEKQIPTTSLLREFLGGSSFHY